MKKMKFLTLLALAALLSVPAQAICEGPVVRHDTGRTIVRRCPGTWGRWTLPDFCLPDSKDTDTPAAPSVPNNTPAAPSVPNNTPAAPSVPDNTPTAPAVPDNTPAVTTDAGMSDYETEVVRLVNAERARYGLAALAADAELSRVARYKSRDMREKGYFSHESPTYGTPFQMMKSFGITYRTAGENIAYGYGTPQKVVEAWMNSEGHRANILNASYTRIGVGYVADGHYWTQMFTG
ncbi:MAG: serine protease [Oscillibacter sp.]|nr:serine protease [Oscillibacter sp.]